MDLFVLYFTLPLALLVLSVFIKYRNSDYKLASGNSFFNTIFSKGNYGEFLTFVKLEKLKHYHRLLTNLYVPKNDGTTTEIDLLMISEIGIHIFESKNYSGWIFGDEKQKYWTQTFQNKQKHQFFNPIWQNNGHLNALKSVLKNINGDSLRSYILFSERCTLKKVNVESKFVKVIKRDELLQQIEKDFYDFTKVFSEEQINEIHEKLSVYCLADDKRKKAHIRNIKLSNSGKL